MKLTLDHNCIIHLEEDRPSAPAVRKLIEAHGAGNLTVRLVAVGASESTRDGETIESFCEFECRLKELGISHLDKLEPILQWGGDCPTFWGNGVSADAEMVALEERIYSILFPNHSYEPPCDNGQTDYAREVRRWRNQLCDAMSMWCHIHYIGDVFVTSDTNFHKERKKQGLFALGAGEIMTPEQAVDHFLI